MVFRQITKENQRLSMGYFYESNEFAEYAPGYISIGNDNGDRELIIKAEKGAVLCGFLDAAEIGSSEPEEWFNFKSWVENG